MIDIQHLLLVLVAYVVPVALLGLAVACTCRDRARVPVIAALSLLPLFYLAHYHLLQTLQGWPVRASLPSEFELVAFRVDEPQPSAGQAGAILLWAIAPDSPRPRAYQVDYTRALHESLVDAGERQQAGHPQSGRVVKTEKSGDRGPAQVRFQDRQIGTLPPKSTETD